MIQNTVDVHRVLRKRAIAREKTHSEFENPPKMSDIPKTNPSLSSYQLEQENKKLVSDIDKFKRDLVRCQNPPKHRRNPSKMKSLEEHKEEVGGKDNPSGSLY
jgi:hypothetical protein